MPLLELGHALFQARDAWLEFRFVDDALGITIDEPTDPASQSGHLAIEADDLIRHGGTVTRLGRCDGDIRQPHDAVLPRELSPDPTRPVPIGRCARVRYCRPPCH